MISLVSENFRWVVSLRPC